MSHYIYDLEDATATINRKDFNTVLAAIKQEVKKPKWNRYGWKDDVLKAETLGKVAWIFDIGLCDASDGNYRPVFDGTYASDFFKYLLEIVTPYMSTGKIVIDDEYGKKSIDF